MSDETCEISLHHVPDETVKKVLRESRTIAVVGLSTNPEKDSHKVPAYLKKKGYRIIPVHPSADEILGEKVYPGLSHIPEKVDIVNVFRPPSEVPAITDSSIEIGAKVIWTQEGIVSNESAKKAEAAGVTMIMGKCIMKEHKAVFGTA